MKPASDLPTRVLSASSITESTPTEPAPVSAMRAPTLPPACAPPRPAFAGSVPACFLRSDGAIRC